MTEREQLQIARELVAALIDLIRDPADQARRLLFAMLADLDSGKWDALNDNLRRLTAFMDDADRLFAAGAARAIRAAHGGMITSSTARFELLGIDRARATIDIKTVNRLIGSAVASHARATERGKRSLELFFNLATRQTQISESEIAQLLARGLIDRRSARESIKLVAARLQDTARILDPAALSNYRSRVMRDLRRKLAVNPRLTPALRAALLEKKRKSLEDGKVLQIVTRSGKIRTYRAETYAEFVSLTKIGDAQVEGEIEAMGQHGLHVLRITDHNTKTAICAPHEGQRYATREGFGYPVLNRSRRPTYHVRCKHRAVADPLAELEAA